MRPDMAKRPPARDAAARMRQRPGWPSNLQDDVANTQGGPHFDAAGPIDQTSAAIVSRVVSITSRPARSPGFTVGFGNTIRSSSCVTV